VNYLELVQDLARQTGTVSGGVPSITSLSGTIPPRVEKMMTWVNDGWTSIQNERDCWLWMQKEFVSALIMGQARYQQGDFDLTRVATWKGDNLFRMPFSIWDPDIGQADEGRIEEIGYEDWRDMYQRGSHDPNRPCHYAIAPTNELVFGPTPDKAYGLRGEYIATPQTLVDGDDIPEMPVRFHKLITFEAVRLLSNSDEAPISAASAAGEGAILRNALINSQLPKLAIGSLPLG
jgi:hypothetical protein